MSPKLCTILFAAAFLTAGGLSTTPARAATPLGGIGESITPFTISGTINFSELGISAGYIAGSAWSGFLELFYDASGTNPIASSSGFVLPAYGCNSICFDTSFATTTLSAGTYYGQFIKTGGTSSFTIGVHPSGIGYAPNDPPYDANSVFYEGDIGPSIYFYFPTNGATSTPFNFWQIGFSNMPTSTAYDGTLSIYYGASSTPDVLTDSGYFSNLGAPAGVITYPRTASELWLPGDSVPKNWGAYGVLIPTNTSTSPINTGAVIFFDIFPVGATSSSPPTTTNCNYTSSTFLFDPIGNIQQGICQALVYLFIPGPSQQNDLVAHFDAVILAVQKKPPFGYFSGAINSFGAIGSGSSSIYVWSAQLVSAFDVILNPIDLAFAALVAILWILWLVRKVENLHRF